MKYNDLIILVLNMSMLSVVIVSLVFKIKECKHEAIECTLLDIRRKGDERQNISHIHHDRDKVLILQAETQEKKDDKKI